MTRSLADLNFWLGKAKYVSSMSLSDFFSSPFKETMTKTRYVDLLPRLLPGFFSDPAVLFEFQPGEDQRRRGNQKQSQSKPRNMRLSVHSDMYIYLVGRYHRWSCAHVV